jgi:hypothetical protein
MRAKPSVAIRDARELYAVPSTTREPPAESYRIATGSERRQVALGAHERQCDSLADVAFPPIGTSSGVPSGQPFAPALTWVAVVDAWPDAALAGRPLRASRPVRPGRLLLPHTQRHPSI